MIRVLGRCMLAILFVLPTLACAPWDLAGLEARHPALARVGAEPLAELTPYFIAMEDELTAFVCRWPTGSRLGVHVVGEAQPGDLRVLERALAAWEGAGLGVVFELGGLPPALEVHFDDTGGMRSGTAAVDCRARIGSSDRLDATLVFASITLRRGALNWKGQRVALAEDERLGAALHELGHALGFQGHPQRGDTVMVRSVDHVRWLGADLAKGRPFRDDALSALYALPSGTVLGRERLPEGRTQGLDAERREALTRGQETWWIRVGDRAARLHWGSGSLPYTVQRVDEIFRDPSRFLATHSSEF